MVTRKVVKFDDSASDSDDEHEIPEDMKTCRDIERCVESMEYVRTVPRHFVHRQAVAEVFVTDYHFAHDSEFEVAIQLPQSHRIFDASHEFHDPLAVAEAFRQAVVLLCHSRYNIPLHYKFLMETFSIDMSMALAVQPAADPLTLHMTVDKLTHRDDAVSGIEVSGVLRDSTQDIARCGAVARGVSPEGYRRIRQGRDDYVPRYRLVPPGLVVVGSEQVGRLTDRDVLISADPAGTTVFCTPDPENYALFDHPVDHIPGMVMFEAARQALRYRTEDPSAQLTGLSAVFPRFTEWEVPCEISVALHEGADHGRGTSIVRFIQDQTLTAELELAVEELQ